jgi:hypothetical protein
MPDESGRNDTLNTEAGSLFRYALAGYATEAEVRDGLTAAMHTNGYIQSDGVRAVEATLTSAWRHAVTQGPKYLEDRDDDWEADHDWAISAFVAPRGAHDREGATVSEGGFTPPARIDWKQLLESTAPTEEWIIEPVIAARRLVAIYSAPKVGKSLLMLEIAVGIARGTRVLGSTPDRPRRVLYVDFENDPHGDIKARLEAMHIRAGDHEQLENLCYLSFPNLAALDTPEGARELAATVAAYDCEVVVIDTISRAVDGEENSNDTWLRFYRHTGKLLKSQGIGLVRLDHTGKDEERGMRGGSAKVGDVDAIWHLSKIGKSDTELKLSLDDARMHIPEQDRTLLLHRRTDPLRHDVDALGAVGIRETKIRQIVDALAGHGAERDITQRDARDLLSGEVPLNQTHLTEALRRHNLLHRDTKAVGINDQLKAIPDESVPPGISDDVAA